ncbi:hypothetical protein VM1G_03662 [Cytospora mali]|uniref:Uncharacterized protein n=1 Tax=Cytospora mali TaxID=578113 RepID=A0A194VV64_CYTMA|nr:hypothetical protein VM1G_03662 [Valsa mali]
MQQHVPLSAELQDEIKYNIISTLFGLSSGQARIRVGEFTEFFQSYSAKLRQLQISAIGSNLWIINQLAARNHEDILCICKALASKKHLKRAEIRYMLQASFSQHEDKALDRSVDLALRLWLMTNIRDNALGGDEPKKSSAQWDDTETLQDLIHRLFPTSDTKLTVREARLGPTFNAAYLFDICGLELDWTDNLQDHLLLDRQTRTLHIFTDQGFLFGHLNAKTCNPEWPP